MYLKKGSTNFLGALLILTAIFFFSCSKSDNKKNPVPFANKAIESNVDSAEKSQEEELPDLAEAITNFSKNPDREVFVEDFWRWIFTEAGIPERIARKVSTSILESPAFIMELLEVLQNDRYTYYLVDKQRSMPDAYEPEDLVKLQAGAYRLGRDGMQLRRAAAEALQEMATAAARDGITLTVGSANRTAEYQAQLYAQAVRTYGQVVADRESAQSGKSQHQLGFTVDFSPIDDSFAKTPANEWLLKNASRFGWSLSYPDGYEEVTGYRWESWHYRYVGKDLASFINAYFEGIQQYALQFIYAWQEQAGE